MSNDSNDELVSQFVDVVSCTPEQATFYLEANKWDLSLAMSQYYEGIPLATSSRHTTTLDEDEDDDEDDEYSERPDYGDSNLASESGLNFPESSRPTTRSKSGAKPASRFATLRDLGETEEDDDDDQKHEKYFAGGERSGISVQGPTKKESNNLVDDILKKAAEGGPAPIDEDDGPSKPLPSFFSGAGYKLGSEEEPSMLVTPPTVLSAAGEADEEEDTRPVTRHLTFWRNGFSVEDGPLLRYDDPANEEFLKAINSGRAPLSLLNVRHGQPVDVRVARRLDEDYTPPPKAPPRAFEGAGHRLGSPVPRVISAADRTPGSYPESSASAGSSSRPVQAAQARQFALDAEAPVTSLQIRMGDGTRLVAKFNHTHTIGDVRGFINASRPGESARPYILQTMFPTKELADEAQTVKDAGLLNAVIVQRYL